MQRNISKTFLTIRNVNLWRRKVSSISSSLIDVASDVREALGLRKPVVALESTIITHGMPYPHNLNTAIRVEDIVREQGATPATIAIIGGRVKVGLDHSVLAELAEMKTPAVKTSRRDFPHVLSNRLNGGTTVSGTVLVANLVGIQIFVTGGIGGVHRGGELSMDVSADLMELGRNPVAVVSSGVKSILDIEKTLEYLETQGVCVVSYGASKQFPAFYSRHSGFQAPYNAATPGEVAAMVHAMREMRMQSGMLVAVPIPRQHDLGDTDGSGSGPLDVAIQLALKEAEERGVTGKEITPFLLSRVSVLTEGRSLTANIALIENNARVGAQVAVALSELQASRKLPSASVAAEETAEREAPQHAAVTGPVVIGGCVLDCVIALDEANIQVAHRASLDDLTSS